MTKFVQVVLAHNTFATYNRGRKHKGQLTDRPVILWGLTENGEVHGIVSDNDGKLVDAETIARDVFTGYEPMNPDAIIPGPVIDHSIKLPQQPKPKKRPKFPRGPEAN